MVDCRIEIIYFFIGYGTILIGRSKNITMKNWISQILLILAFSTVLAVGINGLRGESGIALIGEWKNQKVIKGEAVVPPSAEEGDPPFISISEAWDFFNYQEIIFIDARDPEDYEYAHVQRAINIPFDYIDEEWEAVIDALDRSAEYVIYCSGNECESSLFLGRLMGVEYGFDNLHVFYGGWEEWETNELPIVTADDQAGDTGGEEL